MRGFPNDETCSTCFGDEVRKSISSKMEKNLIVKIETGGIGRDFDVG
jgi:hypothetical protein